MFIIVYFVFRARLFSQVSQNSNICVFSQLPTTLGSLWILSLIPVLQCLLVRVSQPSGLQPSMTSLEACTSWLLGVSQSPPLESRPVTGVPLPPQPCVMSSWSVNSSNSLGRPISQQPVSVGTFVPSAQPIQAVPVPEGYPVYDQSFHRPPYQPQADIFQYFLIFHDYHVR